MLNVDSDKTVGDVDVDASRARARSGASVVVTATKPKTASRLESLFFAVSAARVSAAPPFDAIARVCRVCVAIARRDGASRVARAVTAGARIARRCDDWFLDQSYFGRARVTRSRARETRARASLCLSLV